MIGARGPTEVTREEHTWVTGGEDRRAGVRRSTQVTRAHTHDRRKRTHRCQQEGTDTGDRRGRTEVPAKRGHRCEGEETHL